MDNNKKKEEILPRSRKFAIRVLKLGHYLKNKKVEYFLRDQVARSGASIGANLHEAKASSSDKEFCRFYELRFVLVMKLSIGLKSWMKYIRSVKSLHL